MHFSFFLPFMRLREFSAKSGKSRVFLGNNIYMIIYECGNDN
ncbi:hypothetical protein CPT_Scapp_059 [Serratia phage Scapp]|uniref:Uncharacterized protein n=1 Tax=Serratia phage Scapp TaxID=2282409 RepID=A0A345L6T6_9CAUD|nr:hypothetical protein PP898_gp59 [Serratia phage Scapp]AXH50988.1 hypothetical protein CPT_Scapp_059 [Serratia phage Scapp]